MSQFEHACVSKRDGLSLDSASVINIWCDCSAFLRVHSFKNTFKHPIESVSPTHYELNHIKPGPPQKAAHQLSLLNPYNERWADKCYDLREKECQLFGLLITKENSLGLFNNKVWQWSLPGIKKKSHKLNKCMTQNRQPKPVQKQTLEAKEKQT